MSLDEIGKKANKDVVESLIVEIPTVIGPLNTNTEEGLTEGLQAAGWQAPEDAREAAGRACARTAAVVIACGGAAGPQAQAIAFVTALRAEGWKFVGRQ